MRINRFATISVRQLATIADGASSGTHPTSSTVVSVRMQQQQQHQQQRPRPARASPAMQPSFGRHGHRRRYLYELSRGARSIGRAINYWKDGRTDGRAGGGGGLPSLRSCVLLLPYCLLLTHFAAAAAAAIVSFSGDATLTL